MKITDRLRVEHGVFLWQLAFLERLARSGAPEATLSAVFEAIAGAQRRHQEVEDRILYPELEKVVGAAHPALAQAVEEHERLARVEGDAREAPTPEHMLEFVGAMTAHLEREIHGLFALAEQWLGESTLRSLCNWNVEHVYDKMGAREKLFEGRAAPDGDSSDAS